MAAAKRVQTGGLDALLEGARGSFSGPIPGDPIDPKFHQHGERMTIAPDPEPEPAEPEPTPEPEPVVAEAIPEPAPVDDTPAPTAPTPVKFKVPSGWDDDIDGAPQDGKPVFLIGHPEEDGRDPPVVESIYRHTRAYDRNGGKWRYVGFWAVRNCAGIRVPFIPVGWRPAL